MARSPTGGEEARPGQRDVGLDAGAEVAELAIDPAAPDLGSPGRRRLNLFRTVEVTLNQPPVCEFYRHDVLVSGG